MQSKNRKIIFLFGVSFGLSLFLIFPLQLTAASPTSEKIISRINSIRSQYNLLPLTENYLLRQAANDKLQDMIANNYFAHQSASGKMAWDFMMQSGYDFRYAGENLAMDYTNESDLVRAWMQSNAHRKNILNANFQDTGLALGTNGHHILIVQFFGATLATSTTPSEVKITTPPKTNLNNASNSIISEDVPVENRVDSAPVSADKSLIRKSKTPKISASMLLVNFFTVTTANWQ